MLLVFWYRIRTNLVYDRCTCSIKCSTDDMVTYPWKVFYRPPRKNHAVFLQVVSDTWDISWSPRSSCSNVRRQLRRARSWFLGVIVPTQLQHHVFVVKNVVRTPMTVANPRSKLVIRFHWFTRFANQWLIVGIYILLWEIFIFGDGTLSDSYCICVYFCNICQHVPVPLETKK